MGYVEGRDLFTGRADVLVTDGFTGNVILKTAEGAAQGIAAMMRDEIEKTTTAKAGYLLMRGALRRFMRRLDYAEYGGAPILGVDGVAIVAHGASNANAIKNAIRVARDLARKIPGGDRRRRAEGDRAHPASVRAQGVHLMNAQLKSGRARMIGTGGYAPEKVMTNDDLAKIVDTSDE